MTITKKQFVSFFVLLACLAGFTMSWAAEEKLKVGFVYVSPIGDAGWTYQHDLGRLEMEKDVPQGSVRALHRLQDGQERRHLHVPLL